MSNKGSCLQEKKPGLGLYYFYSLKFRCDNINEYGLTCLDM